MNDPETPIRVGWLGIAYMFSPMLGKRVNNKDTPHKPMMEKPCRTDDTRSRRKVERDTETWQDICPEDDLIKRFCR